MDSDAHFVRRPAGYAKDEKATSAWKRRKNKVKADESHKSVGGRIEVTDRKTGSVFLVMPNGDVLTKKKR
jgi:hypothetical protein